MVLHGFSKTKQVVRLCQLSKMRTWNLFRFQCSTKSLLLDIRLYGNQFYCLTASWLISVTIVNWTFRSQPFTNIGTTPLLQKKHMQVWIQGTECLWVSMEMQPNLWQNVESKRCCVFFANIVIFRPRSIRYSRFLLWSCDVSLLYKNRTVNSILRWVVWSFQTFFMKEFTQVLVLVVYH